MKLSKYRIATQALRFHENSYNRIVRISFRHVHLAFVFLFFQKSYLRPEGKIQKAHSKVATISDPDDAAARGVAPIRQFHKCDESKILPHKRLGLDLI
jgi:hypothetical protein